MESVKIPKFNLELIDITPIIRVSEGEIEEDLVKYNLFPVKLDKDTVSLTYHYLIINICNAIRQSNSIYKTITYTDNQSFMSDYLDHSTGNEFIVKTINRFSNLLPINFWNSPQSFGLIRKILDSDGGERIELEYHLNKFTDTRKKTMYSFNKIKKFSERYGLDFLTKNFFEKVENKQLILG